MGAKKALVTGGSRGIGKAVIDNFTQHEITVAAPTRDELDLNNMTSVKNYIQDHPMDYDILINNAGINPTSPLDQVKESDWDSTLQINLKVPLLLSQACAPHMKKNNWGRIINVSSTFSKVTKAQRIAYTASKSGLDGLTRVLAVELGASNILVNSVCPGFVLTDLTKQNNSDEQIKAFEQLIPLDRLAQPSEIADFIYYLVSPQNTYITGQALSIDGGFICQ